MQRSYVQQLPEIKALRQEQQEQVKAALERRLATQPAICHRCGGNDMQERQPADVLYISVEYCFYLRVPCCGVCSFAAAAAVYLWHNPAIEKVCVVGDARRDELFFAAYRREEGIAGVAAAGAQRVCELEAPQILPRAQLFSSQSWTPGTSVVAIQGGIVLPERELQLCGDIAVGILLRESVQDMPFSVGELAALEPRYLRAVAAKTIAERTGAPNMRQAESG